MGTLADTLGPVVAAPPFTRARCHTIQALERLEKVGDPDDLAAVRAALEPDSGVEHSAIARAFAAVNIPVGKDSITRHRKHECQCSKAVG